MQNYHQMLIIAEKENVDIVLILDQRKRSRKRKEKNKNYIKRIIMLKKNKNFIHKITQINIYILNYYFSIINSF